MSGECDHSMLRLISITGQTIRSKADQWLKKYDLTIEQLQVLKEMTIESGQTQRSLAAATGKSPANITRILDRLEKRGRIVRQSNPDDRRSSLVFLTSDGAAIRNDVEQRLQGLSQKLLSGISMEEEQVTCSVLQKVMANIDDLF